MSASIVPIQQHLVLVVRHVDTGKVRYEFQTWHFQLTRDRLAKLQDDYSARGYRLLHVFLDSVCQLIAFGLAPAGRWDEDHPVGRGLSPVQLLVRSRSSGRARYVSEALPSGFGEPELRRLADAWKEDGFEVMHALVGKECCLMRLYV